MTEYCIKLNKESFYEPAECYNSHLEYKNGIAVIGEIRIDNKRDLQQIEKFNDTKTDVEIIEFLYKKYGEKYIEKIHGAFAFILHDRLKGQLLVARDHLGQKIIYYSIKNNIIYISSSIHKLLDYSAIEKKMNINRVVDLVAHTHSPSTETFFQGIFYLEPSNIIVFNDTATKKEEFNYESEVHVTKNLKELFYESVASVMDANCGSMLSGGLDSSAISSVLQELSTESIQSFSVVFPELSPELKAKTDETEYSAEVVKRSGMHMNRVPITEFNFIKNIKENTAFFEEPFMATNTYIYEEVFKAMRKKGVDMVLDGTDGDSVISHGTEIFRHYGNKFEIRKLLKEKRAFDKVNGINHSALRTIISFVIVPRIPKWLSRPLKRMRNTDFFHMQNILLSKAYKKTKGRLYKDVDRIYNSKKSFNNFAEKAHYMMVYKSHWDDVFNILNIIAKKYSVEIRFPFFYQPLVDYCLNEPVTNKIKEGVTRHNFREALKDQLPKKIYERKSKSDLSPIFTENFMDIDSKYLNQVFFEKNSPIYNLIDKEEVKKLLDSKDPKKNLSIIYTFFSLYEWMKKNHFEVNIEK
jgi:asparagine synthase (glutamine-hydrolysing)